VYTETLLQKVVALTFIPGLNTVAALPVIRKCSGVEGLFLEKEKTLIRFCAEAGISLKPGARSQALALAEKELPHIEKHAIRICCAEESDYPFLLLQCTDAPFVLYYRGTLSDPAGKYLAVVGTRRASVRCKSRVHSLLEALAGYAPRPVVVSGLAFGIDISAHLAALEFGFTTYAVLGHGLHKVYPSEHRNTAERILAAGGALISEFPCTGETYKTHFLQRNRIVAGLSHGVLIAESAVQGGAMTTARIGVSYNRDVMAFPGRPEDLYARGCNLLIKFSMAALVEEAGDVAAVLNLTRRKSRRPTAEIPGLFPEDERKAELFALLSERGERALDDLSLLCGIPAGELNVLLLQLQLEGKVIALPGSRYGVR
jgi:DNA processing protein